MGFIKEIAKPFVKGTATVGTWFGIPKSTTKHLAHVVYGTEDPSTAKAKKATLEAGNNANEAVIADRQRRRAGSALATGAPDSGGALTTSAITYGKSTLGG